MLVGTILFIRRRKARLHKHKKKSNPPLFRQQDCFSLSTYVALAIKLMKILHHVELKVKVNRAGEKYVHVKAKGVYYCPLCHKKMRICGSKRRKYKAYINRNHEDNAWDILELNNSSKPGIDWYPDKDDITFELVLFTIPVFLCLDCQASRNDHPQHYHRGIVEDVMQTRLWYTIKAMCDTATFVEMPAELCSDDNDIFQTKRMIRRIIHFAWISHISNRQFFRLQTNSTSKTELIRVIRETVSARVKKFFK